MKNQLDQMEHPMQPIGYADDGVIRFKRNPIVAFLLDWASQKGMDLNTLHMMNFSGPDWEQFNQLIGYSVSGWGDLSMHRPEKVAEADTIAEKLYKKKDKKK